MAKSEDRFREVVVYVKDEAMARLRKKYPHLKGEDSAIISALVDERLVAESKVSIASETLREIAAIAGVARIQSETELLASVRSAAKLNEHCAVVRLDPAMVPVVYEVARSNKLTLSETLTNYVHHCINNGQFNQWQSLSYFTFTPEQYERLKKEMGVTGRPSADDVLKFIVAARLSLSRNENVTISNAPAADEKEESFAAL